jgi:hypothetical protein
MKRNSNKAVASEWYMKNRLITSVSDFYADYKHAMVLFFFAMVSFLLMMLSWNNLVAADKLFHHIRATAVVEAPCPLDCGNIARRYLDEAKFFWRCTTCSPGSAFKDVDGKPTVENW